jgi:uncharacterized protein (TIGR02246 family)
MTRRGHQPDAGEVRLCHHLGIGTRAAHAAGKQQHRALDIGWTCIAKLPVSLHRSLHDDRAGAITDIMTDDEEHAPRPARPAPAPSLKCPSGEACARLDAAPAPALAILPAMSEESTTPGPVELVGRAFEAANRRDLDTVASSFAEDATFDGRALGEHFEGRAAIRSFLEDWFRTYEELEFGLEEVRDLGNGVVFAVVVQNGRPAGSAGHLRQLEGWVIVLARGLIARLTVSEVEEARAAAERLAQERG